MTPDFNQEIDRTGTNCTKWDFRQEGEAFVYGDHSHAHHGDERLLPLWVADMDFRSPQPVIDALKRRAEHGIFGYCLPGDGYYEAVLDWMARRYGRIVERDWIVLTPGVIPAINKLIETFVRPGQKVLVQGPVYYPFFDAIMNNGAQIVSNSLRLVDGRYQMDFEDLEAKTADPDLTLAILCSPHNPVGRVWSGQELRRFGEICLANDVLVIADEIHCDLLYDGVEFVSFATLGEEFAAHSIVCTAPSKTFNLAGLRNSNIVISNPGLRRPFQQTLERHAAGGSNIFGLEATEAAYRHGEPWLRAVMDYVQGNYRFLEALFAQHLPQARPVQPEGTYLAWVDFRALDLAPAERKELLMGEAKVWLDEGEMFGAEGTGFERFNIACPRPLLEEALSRVCRTLSPLAA